MQLGVGAKILSINKRLVTTNHYVIPTYLLLTIMQFIPILLLYCRSEIALHYSQIIRYAQESHLFSLYP